MLRMNLNPCPRTPALSLALLLSCFLHTHLAICDAVPVMRGRAARSGGEIDVAPARACSRSIGDCLSEAEAMEMESETSRRVLLMQQRKYISYETLRRDMVPCTTAGASYYNCHSGTANHYNRGCEVITWCARNIRDIKT
ncbi:hypothetical protein NL676_022450 [Syzygium grande]|nr:hypothetical protein NL676_022450 [Syzygium grande]